MAGSGRGTLGVAPARMAVAPARLPAPRGAQHRRRAPHRQLHARPPVVSRRQAAKVQVPLQLLRRGGRAGWTVAGGVLQPLQHSHHCGLGGGGRHLVHQHGQGVGVATRYCAAHLVRRQATIGGIAAILGGGAQLQPRQRRGGGRGGAQLQPRHRRGGGRGGARIRRPTAPHRGVGGRRVRLGHTLRVDRGAGAGGGCSRWPAATHTCWLAARRPRHLSRPGQVPPSPRGQGQPPHASGPCVSGWRSAICAGTMAAGSGLPPCAVVVGWGGLGTGGLGDTVAALDRLACTDSNLSAHQANRRDCWMGHTCGVWDRASLEKEVDLDLCRDWLEVTDNGARMEPSSVPLSSAARGPMSPACSATFLAPRVMTPVTPCADTAHRAVTHRVADRVGRVAATCHTRTGTLPTPSERFRRPS